MPGGIVLSGWSDCCYIMLVPKILPTWLQRPADLPCRLILHNVQSNHMFSRQLLSHRRHSRETLHIPKLLSSGLQQPFHLPVWLFLHDFTCDLLSGRLVLSWGFCG